MKSIVKKVSKTVLVSAAIVFFIIVCMYHSACHITPEGIVLLTEDYICPKIQDYCVEGAKITVRFTKPVNVEEAFAVEAGTDKNITSIENFLNAKKKIKSNYNVNHESCSVDFELTEETQIGKKYELYSVVRDEKGSSLSFALPFFGENDHFPEIIISEVNETYSAKDGVSEYIELFVLTSGNLFGLELISASDGREFELPEVEVNKGEYIVVHLRKNQDDTNAITELTKNLSESTAKGSVYGARDIWMDKSESALSSTAEIIILKNKAKNEVIDCLLYCKKEYADINENWKTEELQRAAQLCVSSGVWEGSGKPIDAVFSTERKSISYISRKNIALFTDKSRPQNNSSCWTGTPKSKMSPGRPNRW